MNWKTLIIAMFGVWALVVIARPQIFKESVQPPPIAIATPQVKVVTKEVVKHEVEYRPTTRPDGYISKDACLRIAQGTSISDLVWRFGWPAGDSGDDSFSGVFYYPSRDDHNDQCVIDTMAGKVYSLSYQE